MLGCLNEVMESLYLNPATDDLWEIVEERHETARGTVVVDLTVRYVLSLPEAEQAASDDPAWQPIASNGAVQPDGCLALKLSGEAAPGSVRRLRVEFYREAMAFIHAHDVRVHLHRSLATCPCG